MKEKTEFWLLQIFATKIGWLAISAVLIVTFGILANFYPWAETAVLISLIYPIVLTLIMLVYAWIINPIKAIKEKLNEKQANKKGKKTKK